MSTTQPVGFAMRFVHIGSSAARLCPYAVERTDSGGELPIRVGAGDLLVCCIVLTILRRILAVSPQRDTASYGRV